MDSVLGDVNGTYQWIDGSAVGANGFDRWGPGEPDHHNQPYEDYMLFGCLQAYTDCVWVDINGVYSFAYLCQEPVF